jgi:hypothetical protein
MRQEPLLCAEQVHEALGRLICYLKRKTEQVAKAPRAPIGIPGRGQQFT